MTTLMVLRKYNQDLLLVELPSVNFGTFAVYSYFHVAAQI